MKEATKHSQAHATFVIERTYPVPVAVVWHALSDGAARDAVVHRGRRVRRRREAARLPGRRAEHRDRPVARRPAVEVPCSTYTDIVEPQRIVFTYDMWVDDRHLSTSVTTIALEDDGDRTLLTYVEQGVHFDGLDSPEGREEGTKGLLDQLGAYLAHGR